MPATKPRPTLLRRHHGSHSVHRCPGHYATIHGEPWNTTTIITQFYPLAICNVAEEVRQQSVDRHPALTMSFGMGSRSSSRQLNPASHHQSVCPFRLTHGPARLDVQISLCVLRCIGIINLQMSARPPARQQAPLSLTLPLPLALGKSQCGNPRSSHLISQDPYSLSTKHTINGGVRGRDTHTRARTLRISENKVRRGPTRRTGNWAPREVQTVRTGSQIGPTGTESGPAGARKGETRMQNHEGREMQNRNSNYSV